MKLNKKLLLSTLGILSVGAVITSASVVLSSCNDNNRNSNSSNNNILIDLPNKPITDTSKIATIPQALELSENIFDSIMKDQNKFQNYEKINLQNFANKSFMNPQAIIGSMNTDITESQLVNVTPIIIDANLKVEYYSPVQIYKKEILISNTTQRNLINKLSFNNDNSINFTFEYSIRSKSKVKYLGKIYDGEFNQINTMTFEN